VKNAQFPLETAINEFETRSFVFKAQGFDGLTFRIVEVNVRAFIMFQFRSLIGRTASLHAPQCIHATLRGGDICHEHTVVSHPRQQQCCRYIRVYDGM